MKHVVQDSLWAGTEASLNAYLASAESIADKMTAGAFPGDEDDDDDLPDLLDIQGGVGIVSVHGSLTNRDSPWNRFFGVTSYNAIREALTFAASREDVSAIVLDVNSGGGAVNGVADAANLIQSIDKNVKPVIAYTDGAMASAAYWLGSSAREVYASNVAVVGSIGVLSTHMEQSKRLKDEGIGVTVMRSGKYKALANSVEPLTEAAKEQIQSQLDTVYQIFAGHVASARGKSLDYVDAHMAQGREFIGQQALAASLVDGIETFDSMMSRVQKRFVASSSQGTGTGGGAPLLQQGTPTMKKHAMTEQEMAAIAAGIPVEAATDAEGQSATSEVTSAPEKTNVEAQVEAKSETQKEAVVDQSALVAYLQGEVKAKSDAVLEAQVEARTLKAKLESLEASTNGLKDIVAKSLNQMRIALGSSALDFSASGAADLLAEHARVSADFKANFKAGGVAAVDAAPKAENREGAVMTNVSLAQLNALRGK